MELVLKGHITPEDKRKCDYAYVPFELPEPARRLQVAYTYSAPIGSDQTEGGNVIDIGLFDPRGSEFPGGAGFRGWSGSARREFTITPREATPGYLPGPLPAGRYEIILGLYRIWQHGADYEIQVQADLGADGSALASAPIHPSRRPASSSDSPALWLCGDLQSHSEHSDGKGTLAQLTSKARALGLDFLAVTEHNTVSHYPYLPGLEDEHLLLIPGQEVTTYRGHMNIWGTRRWCDFRCGSDDGMTEVIQLAQASGGLCSINHPKAGGPAWEYDLCLPVDAIEVWQGPWPWRNEESLAIWERLLLSGRHLPAVGGSDYHCPARGETGYLRVGQPTTWVKAVERSVPAILDAIQAGRVSISAYPNGPHLDLVATASGAMAEMGEELPLAPGAVAEVEVRVQRGAGWKLRLIADGNLVYETLIDAGEATLRREMTADIYVRAELVADAPRELIPEDVPIEIDLRDWRWALSNPIYIQRQENPYDH